MNEQQWEAIRTNNKTYDGIFYYALSTTKTVCRPSCTSRTPNPKHVFIYRSVEAAVHEGFRPCTRCKPEAEDWEGYQEEVAKAAAAYLQTHYHDPYRLAQLGEALKKHPSYIHRSFKAIHGMTPLAYLHTLRLEEAKRLLHNQHLSMIDVALDVGYNDSTQFSVKFKAYTGMAPSIYQKSLKTKSTI